ncbi:MAG: hypothetical protein ACLQGJ_02975 [Candidatus Dormibacteria bacterium]
MLSEGHSFTWTSNIDQDLSFWFWLRREGRIGAEELGDRVRQWATREGWSLDLARRHPEYPLYLPVGKAWREAEDRRHQLEFEPLDPVVYQSHYREMEVIGIQVHVEWVMAPLGERWLIPPDLALLGVMGADAQARLKAVLSAARTLRNRRTH